MNTNRHFKFEHEDETYSGTVNSTEDYHLITIDQMPGIKLKVSTNEEQDVLLLLPTDRPDREPAIAVALDEAPIFSDALASALGH